MLKTLHNLPPFIFILIATLFEVSGDAIIRRGMYEHTGTMRLVLLLGGAVCVFLYGSFINFNTLEFGKIAGLYIATLFIVWQVMNFIFFKATPTLPIIVGGSLIVAGGLIVTFWN
jgi:hypothetical protein